MVNAIQLRANKEDYEIISSTPLKTVFPNVNFLLLSNGGDALRWSFWETSLGFETPSRLFNNRFECVNENLIHDNSRYVYNRCSVRLVEKAGLYKADDIIICYAMNTYINDTVLFATVKEGARPVEYKKGVSFDKGYLYISYKDIKGKVLQYSKEYVWLGDNLHSSLSKNLKSFLEKNKIDIDKEVVDFLKNKHIEADRLAKEAKVFFNTQYEKAIVVENTESLYRNATGNYSRICRCESSTQKINAFHLVIPTDKDTPYKYTYEYDGKKLNIEDMKKDFLSKFRFARLSTPKETHPSFYRYILQGV